MYLYACISNSNNSAAIDIERLGYKVRQSLVSFRNIKVGVRILVCCCGLPNLCNSKPAVLQQQMISCKTA